MSGVEDLTEWIWLLDISLRATVLLLLAVVADRVLKKHPLKACAMWSVCLVALLAMPGLHYLVPARISLASEAAEFATPVDETMRDLGTEVEYVSNRTQVKTDSDSAGSFEATTRSADAINEAEAWPVERVKTGRSSAWLAWALLGAGYAFVTARLIYSLRTTHWIAGQSTAVTDQSAQKLFQSICSELHLGTNRELYESASVRVPIVAGIFRPRVVVPTNFAAQSDEPSDSLRVALLHELTHIRRRDSAWALLLEIVTAMYWFNPLVWFMRSRITDLRERVCDEHCVYRLGGSSVYVDTLINLASRIVHEPSSPLRVAAVRRSKLAERIAEVGQSEGNQNWQARKRVWCGFAVAAISFTALATTVSLTSPVTLAAASDEKSLSFTAAQKRQMRELLDDGDAVPAPDKILKMLAERTRANAARIRTWEGTYLLRSANGNPEDTSGGSMAGRFSLDTAHDLVFVNCIPRPAMSSDGVQTSWSVPTRNFDPRHLAANGDQEVHDLLAFLLKKREPGFWDRASLSRKKSASGGIAYRLKVMFFQTKSLNAGAPINECATLMEYVFDEAVDFQPTVLRTRWFKAKSDTVRTIRYEVIDKVQVPKACREVQTMTIGGSRGKSTTETQVFTSRLNAGLTFHHDYHLHGAPTPEPEGSAAIARGNSGVNVAMPVARWAKAPDYARRIRHDCFEFKANEDGSLAEIVHFSELGKGRRYSSVDDLAKQMKQFVRKLDPQLARHLQIRIRADTKLGSGVLEQALKGLQFEIPSKSSSENVIVPKVSLRKASR